MKMWLKKINTKSLSDNLLCNFIMGVENYSSVLIHDYWVSSPKIFKSKTAFEILIPFSSSQSASHFHLSDFETSETSNNVLFTAKTSQTKQFRNRLFANSFRGAETTTSNSHRLIIPALSN